MDFTALLQHTHTEHLIVEMKDTAKVYGSGALEVFATPAMIGLMEMTCLKSIADKIGDDNTTVGTKVNISHLKASPIGAVIRCTSKVIEVEGRRVAFEVQCFEGDTLIGEGHHERFIVDSKRFMSKFQ